MLTNAPPAQSLQHGWTCTLTDLTPGCSRFLWRFAWTWPTSSDVLACVPPRASSLVLSDVGPNRACRLLAGESRPSWTTRSEVFCWIWRCANALISSNCSLSQKKIDGRGEWWTRTPWAAFCSTRFFTQQWRRTLGLGAKSAWAWNWETRKEIAYPTGDLLATCLWWRTLWNSSKGWWLSSKKVQNRKGLTFNPDKTKILTSQKSNRLKEIQNDEMHVEILPPEWKV